MTVYSYLGLSTNERFEVLKKKYTVIIDTVCEFYKITQETLAIRSKKTEIVYRRQMAHYFLKRYTSLNEKMIGMVINGCEYERTTIINSIQAIKDYYDTDEAKRLEIDCLDAIIKVNLKNY